MYIQCHSDWPQGSGNSMGFERQQCFASGTAANYSGLNSFFHTQNRDRSNGGKKSPTEATITEAYYKNAD